jgi:hypothetical protein
MFNQNDYRKERISDVKTCLIGNFFCTRDLQNRKLNNMTTNMLKAIQLAILSNGILI